MRKMLTSVPFSLYLLPGYAFLSFYQLPDSVKLQQDTVLALMKSSTVFINYLSELFFVFVWTHTTNSFGWIN